MKIGKIISVYQKDEFKESAKDSTLEVITRDLYHETDDWELFPDMEIFLRPFHNFDIILEYGNR